MLRPGFILIALCLGFRAHAALETQNLESLDFSLDDLMIQKKLLIEINDKTKAEIRSASEKHLRLMTAKPKQGLFFDDIKSVQRRHSKKLKLSDVRLRNLIKKYENIEAQLAQLEGEVHWTNFRIEFLQKHPQKVSANQSVTQCELLPIRTNADQALSILSDFGPRKDKETGLKWTSQGWWIGAQSQPVQSCGAAKIIFIGEIVGRQQVVILEHLPGLLSVYANLESNELIQAKVGAFVKAGTKLGIVSQKLYFELRKDQSALNPRRAFNSSLLSRFTGI